MSPSENLVVLPLWIRNWWTIAINSSAKPNFFMIPTDDVNYCVEVTMLFSTFLFELAGSEDYILHESCIVCGKGGLVHVCLHTVEQDSAQDLACYGQEEDASVVFVCMFGVYRPTREFFTHMETSLLPMKGYKF